MHAKDWTTRRVEFPSTWQFFYLVLLIGINSLAMQISSARVPIWPQLDNLSSLTSFLSYPEPDFYSNSLIHSPRIFAIAIFKIFSLVTSIEAASVITSLGAILAVIGLPLFIFAVGKKIQSRKKSRISIVQILLSLFLLVALNLDGVHSLEVNGFYLNPFIQGATTSNIAAALFLIGFIIDKARLRWTLIVLSILTHVTTGIFLILIFMFPNHADIRTMIFKTKHRAIIVGIAIPFSIFLGWFYTSHNLSPWKYYINERAANHFLITTESKGAFQLALLVSLICAIFIANSGRNSKIFAVAHLIIGIAIICTSYPYYALPFGLAAIGITISKKSSLFVTSSITLLFLLSMQNASFVMISTGFSMFLPGTRFVSLVSLYSLCVIVLAISEKLAKRNPKNFIEDYGGFVKSTITLISAGIILVGIQVTTSNLSHDFSALRSQVSREFPEEVTSLQPILPIAINTVGWREFENANIFVDEYPFWGDLREYMNRSKFKSDLEFKIKSNQINQSQVTLLLETYNIKGPMTLVIGQKATHLFDYLKCTKRSLYIICNLENTNAS